MIKALKSYINSHQEKSQKICK